MAFHQGWYPRCQKLKNSKPILTKPKIFWISATSLQVQQKMMPSFAKPILEIFNFAVYFEKLGWISNEGTFLDGTGYFEFQEVALLSGHRFCFWVVFLIENISKLQKWRGIPLFSKVSKIPIRKSRFSSIKFRKYWRVGYCRGKYFLSKLGRFWQIRCSPASHMSPEPAIQSKIPQNSGARRAWWLANQPPSLASPPLGARRGA